MRHRIIAHQLLHQCQRQGVGVQQTTLVTDRREGVQEGPQQMGRLGLVDACVLVWMKATHHEKDEEGSERRENTEERDKSAQLQFEFEPRSSEKSKPSTLLRHPTTHTPARSAFL